jgi:hypothetical protein
MEAKFKGLIKEAVLEALADYSNQGVAVASTDRDTTSTTPTDTTKVKKPGRPGPIIGPAGFSLR